MDKYLSKLLKNLEMKLTGMRILFSRGIFKLEGFQLTLGEMLMKGNLGEPCARDNCEYLSTQDRNVLLNGNLMGLRLGLERERRGSWGY